VRALLLAIETGRAPVLHENATASFPGLLASKQWHDAQMHLQDQWQDYQAKRQRIESEVQRLKRTLPLARQRAADYAELAKSHDVSQHAWLEKEQARIEMEGQLRDAKHQLASLISETRKSAQEALNDATRLVASTQKEAQRAAVHGELLRLTSPVDGTVQQLVVHTVGGVVPAAQPLMQIVPKNAPVEMEAFIENKDVGFVQTGQEAQVKVDTFEYTKYGTIAARVSHVSQDAIQDEKRGLIYAVKVSLLEPTMNIDGRQVVLSPGMSGSVEIKTGSRRVIEYVLSPLLQHTRESLRER
jgi:hemolysin D